LKISFNLTSKARFESRCSQIITPHLTRIQYLNISKYFLDYFSLHLFSSLQCLVVQQIESKQILSINSQLTHLNHLQSLTIQSTDYFHNENFVYRSIFRLKHLIFCKLIFPAGGQRVPLSFSSIDYCQIRILILDGQCHFDQLISLLSYTINLKHLSCQHLYGTTANNFEFQLNLRSLSLSLYRICFDELKVFLMKIGCHLRKLEIQMSNDENYLQADQWEQLIRQSLTNLTGFCFQYSGLMCDENLLENFSSRFWKDKNWLFQYYSYEIDERIYMKCFNSIGNHFQFYNHQPKLIGRIDCQYLSIEEDFNLNDYSIEFPHVKYLTLKNRNLSCLNDLQSMILFTQITSLILKNASISLNQLLLFPNLKDLSTPSFTSYRTNKNFPIRKLILDEDICQLGHVRFLSQHFPQLERLEICINELDYAAILEICFLKFISLCSLFLLNINSSLKEQIQVAFVNVHIERIHGGLNLWW